MLNRINKLFSKGEAQKMAALKPDDPKKPRTIKNPDLDTWIGEAGAVGLYGEAGNGEGFNLSVGDLKNQPDMTVAEIPDRHGLHLVIPEESGEPIDDVLGKPAVNSEVEIVEKLNPTEIRFNEQIAALIAQRTAIERAIAVVEADRLAYLEANKNVKNVGGNQIAA